MKRTSIKILIIVLIAGIISIAGEVVLSGYVNYLSEKHRVIVNEYFVNADYVARLNVLIYEHEAMLGHMIVSDRNTLEQNKIKEKEIRDRIRSVIEEFSERMKGGEGEKIFHIVYSNVCSYYLNIDKLISYCEEGSTEIALYYFNESLIGFINTIDENLDNLDVFTEKEIERVNADMDKVIDFSKSVEYFCLAVVAVLTLFSIYNCHKITKSMENSKEYLEDELQRRTAQLRKKTENMLTLQDGIIIGMANLIENRDGDTGEHVKRTSAYVSMLARALSDRGVYSEVLTDEYIEKLVKAAPLHDVGKIAVPDSILLKPGKLTDEEFAVIKSHVTAGGKILEDIFENLEDREFVGIAIDIAKYHHEKWDGSGYGTGLSEKQIPLAARIMAIADVFDALVSKRCYKEAFTLDDAFKIIRKSSGSHFDPEIASVFFEIRKDIEAYIEKPM